MERQHQQYIDSLEEQEKQHQDSIEQLQQQFNDSMEQQQEYVIKLENTMKEKISTLEEGMIYIFLTCSRLCHAMFLHIEVYPFYSKMTIGCLFRWKRIFTVGRSVGRSGPLRDRSGPGRSVENVFLSKNSDLRDLNKTCACTTSAMKPSPTDLKREGYLASGVYDIRLVASNKIIKVYCDMTTDGGGWLVRWPHLLF